MDPIETKIKALEDFVDRKDQLKKTAPLQYLFWEATLRCNLECLHCGSDCVRDNSTQSGEIGADLVKRELASIAQLYPPNKITLAIIGGEPLVRRDIIEVGEYAAGLGYNWGITTNGMLLDKPMIQRLKDAGLRTISVSLDGVEQDHDKLRNRPGSHKTVTTAIRNLLDDPFFLTFDIICCVSKINIGRLEEFVEDLVRMEVPAARFTPVFSRGRAGRKNHLTLEKDDYNKMLHFIARQRAQRTGIKIYLSEEGYWGPEWECVVRDEFHYCASGILIGSILYDGKVTGCPSVSRSFIEGNIRQTPFVEIWKNRFSRYRGGRKETFGAACAGCEHWILCEGGGFHLLDQANSPANHCCLKKIG